jgi:hypothetical protein
VLKDLRRDLFQVLFEGHTGNENKCLTTNRHQ